MYFVIHFVVETDTDEDSYDSGEDDEDAPAAKTFEVEMRSPPKTADKAEEEGLWRLINLWRIGHSRY